MIPVAQRSPADQQEKGWMHRPDAWILHVRSPMEYVDETRPAEIQLECGTGGRFRLHTYARHYPTKWLTCLLTRENLEVLQDRITTLLAHECSGGPHPPERPCPFSNWMENPKEE